MRGNSKAHVFVVDDDACICDAVSLNLKSADFECSCFESADECLKYLHTRDCDLLVTDVKMPDKDGIELLTEAKRIVPWLPVLVMTGYGDIPLAVRAVKAGAASFIEKPLQWEDFLPLVKSIIKQNEPGDLLRGKLLTETEKIVLRFILEGKSNKAIACVLGRSVRTIEVHRSHIMHKFDVDNVVNLVKRAAAMGMGNLM